MRMKREVEINSWKCHRRTVARRKSEEINDKVDQRRKLRGRSRRRDEDELRVCIKIDALKSITG